MLKVLPTSIALPKHVNMKLKILSRYLRRLYIIVAPTLQPLHHSIALHIFPLQSSRRLVISSRPLKFSRSTTAAVIIIVIIVDINVYLPRPGQHLSPHPQFAHFAGDSDGSALLL
jgi:hypothetical membrane protein